MKKYILSFISLLPFNLGIRCYFIFKQRYLLKLSFPRTFSEKIQKRKLEMGKDTYFLADKLAVRKYVEDKIGSEYLIPLIWCSKVGNLDGLPTFEKYAVMKTNHGSGSGHLEFLPTERSKEELVNKFSNALKERYIGSYLGEKQYDAIEPRVIVEEKLNGDGPIPPDYKFHVFRNQGNVKTFLQVDFDRFTNHKRNYYDENFNLLNLEVIYSNGEYTLPEIEELKSMQDVAIKLLGDLDYARIDLYLLEEKIYFGEITLTPGSGFERFSSRETDAEWGELWR